MPKVARWWRFSLRGMLLAVTLVCIWLSVQVNSARRQRQAVEAILKAGGGISFDYQKVAVPGKPNAFEIDRDAPPVGPGWLRAGLGEDYFRTAIGVSLPGNEISETDFALLANLPRLESVFLCEVKVVPQNSGSKRRIQDTDLKIFKNLNQLREFTLLTSDVDGSGLASLLNSKQLTDLRISNSPINDQGLVQIGKLTALEKLIIEPPRKANITDNGFKLLRNLVNLESLYLVDTHISDAGLITLKDLTKLKDADLSESEITAEGVRGLKKYLPKTEIWGP